MTMAANRPETTANPDPSEIARAAFAAANDALFVLDPERDRIVEANPQACALLGYPRDELLATPISAIHPREMIELLAFVRSVLDAGRGWTDRLSCTTKTGDRLPAEFSAAPVAIAGRPCLIVIVRPIQPRNYQILLEQFSTTAALTGEAFFQSLVQQLATALQVRHALIATVPASNEHRPSRGFWWNGRQVEPYVLDAADAPTARVLAGEIVHYRDELQEVYPAIKDLAPGAVSYLGFPLRTASGATLGLIAVLDDKPMPAIPFELSVFRLFAERARAELERGQFERALLAEKRVAEAASRAKTDFLANLSHELRTPLNGILGYAQLLGKADNLTAEQRDAVAVIQRGGEHLLNLINDLLDLSKIEARRLDAHREAFHFATFLRLLVEMVRERAEAKGLHFVFEAGAGLPVAVRGDEKRLRQILINLLGNAVKFTDRGTVRFRVEHRDGQARFEIADTGIGIPEEHLEAIFQPFQRLADGARAREGSGLGLAICRRLIDALDGALQVRSRVGAGSVFEVTLPLPVARDFAVAESTPEREISGYGGSRRRILVADDRPDNRQLLRRILEPLGFLISEADHGEAAITRARAERPDAILMDLVMPVLDGFEATRRLRAMPELEGLVILGLSASVFEEDQRGSLSAGCDGFIAKPVRAAELLRALRTHLQLEWTYRAFVEPDDEPPPAPPPVPDHVPPREELESLRELAALGDIQTLVEAAARLEAADPRHQAFARRLREAARGFQINALRAFLNELLAR